MEKNLSDFKWAGHRSAHRHQARDCAHVIVGGIWFVKEVGDYHGQETGLNVTSTPAGKSGPSAQDRYCARSFREGAKKRRANEKE